MASDPTRSAAGAAAAVASRSRASGCGRVDQSSPGEAARMVSWTRKPAPLELQGDWNGACMTNISEGCTFSSFKGIL